MENNNLHFITGLMGAGKTKHLIDFYEESEKQGKFVWPFAGSLNHTDIFEGVNINSRDGRTIEAIGIDSTGATDWLFLNFSFMPEKELVVIDEIQFLSVAQMEIIIKFAKEKDLKVLLCGLDRDFKNDQFPAVTALIKEKPEITFIVTHCQMDDCTDYAENNARIVNGHVVTDGETFLEEKSSYLSICDRCFKKMTIE